MTPVQDERVGWDVLQGSCTLCWLLGWFSFKVLPWMRQVLALLIFRGHLLPLHDVLRAYTCAHTMPLTGNDDRRDTAFALSKRHSSSRRVCKQEPCGA